MEGKQADKIAKQSHKMVDQNEYNDVFAAFMAKEYADEKIGDLEGVDPLDYIDDDEEEEQTQETVLKEEKEKGEGDDEPDYYDYGELEDSDDQAQIDAMMEQQEQKEKDDRDLINEAVDEFIEDKQNWFRDLHKRHGAKDGVEMAIEKGKEFKEGTAMHIPNVKIKVAGEIEEESEQYKKMMAERTLYQFSDKDTDEEEDSSESEQEQWDAETILTTYTNTDNHPHLIKYTPKVKPNKAN